MPHFTVGKRCHRDTDSVSEPPHIVIVDAHI